MLGDISKCTLCRMQLPAKPSTNFLVQGYIVCLKRLVQGSCAFL